MLGLGLMTTKAHYMPPAMTCIRVLTTQSGLVANTVAAPAPEAAITLLSSVENAAAATGTKTVHRQRGEEEKGVAPVKSQALDRS